MTTEWTYEELLTEAKTGGAWPEGWYAVQVASADPKMGGTGRHQLALELRVLNGAYMGKTLTRTLSIVPEHPNLLRQFFDIVRGFGLTDDYLKQLGNAGLEPLAQVLVGRVGEVELVHRDFNGRASNDIANARPAAANTAGVVPVGVPGDRKSTRLNSSHSSPSRMPSSA